MIRELESWQRYNPHMRSVRVTGRCGRVAGGMQFQRHFIANIKEANIEDLMTVNGINAKIARLLIEKL